VFAARDGVLVVADGREVEVGDEGQEPVWVSDTAVKIIASADGAPLVVVGVGLVAVQKSGAEREVLAILEEISSSPRPEFGLAAGEGPWTAEALTYQAANAIDDDAGAFVDHRVLVLAVSWSACASEPELWKLSVGSLNADGIEVLPDEDDPAPSEGKIWVTYAADASQVHAFPAAGFYGIPDRRLSDDLTPGSQVMRLIRDTFDRTAELADDPTVDVTDVAWLSTYRLAGLDIATVRRNVETTLRQLVAEHADAFRACHVGGYWTFAQVLRDGQVVVEEPVKLGPMHVPGDW
jgi:hypothetical protein